MAQLTRYIRSVTTALARRWPIDLAGGIERTILVVGTGRSGTTWLAEVINHANRFRILMETLRSAEVPAMAAVGFNRYIPPDADDPQARALLHTAFTGRLSTRWINAHNQRFIARHRLVKEIRASLMLGYIARQFPDLTIVRIVRHPCAVALSYTRKDADPHWDALVAQPLLQRDFLAAILPALSGAPADRFEAAALRWCVDQRVALEHGDPQRIRMVFYEDLCANPAATLPPLLESIGVPLHPRRFNRCIHRPSRTATQHSAIVTGNSSIENWQRFVTPAQIDRVMQFLHAFNLTHLYGPGPRPRHSPAAEEYSSLKPA